MDRAGRQRRAEEEEGTGTAAWRRALATGDRAALLPETLRALVAEAGREERLGAEIGALRLAAERLLADVPDAAQLAKLLPPVVNAIVRALQAQRALGHDDDDAFAQLMRRALALANETIDGGP